MFDQRFRIGIKIGQNLENNINSPVAKMTVQANQIVCSNELNK